MIIYTKTDEAPALATYSLFPIIMAFISKADVACELWDISLAGRIIAQFPEYLSEEQRIPDALTELGRLVLKPDANIIKLPNISASIPQIKQAVKELREKGCGIPQFPENPATEEEQEIRKRYDRVKGSAVNPVLREGNSDRRVPPSVKKYARAHPHSMGAWASTSKSHVASMSEGDFYGSEQSMTMDRESTLSITLLENGKKKHVLKKDLRVQKGEIIDAALMSRKSLRDFLRKEIDDARARGVLFSIHVKATMMKVSDPIIFGHAVSVFFEDVFTKYADTFADRGVNANNGLADLYAKLDEAPESLKAEIHAAMRKVMEEGPEMAMVNSDRGITNLHVPSDIIIDASMPAAIRSSGKMWGADGKLKDMKAIIPDRSYAGVYAEVIAFCKQNGALDPSTMGSFSNVGLMAQKAEEYGSHDKTFELPASGRIEIRDENEHVLFTLEVKKGDIFRMCQVKDAPVRDWIKLAVERAKTAPVIFWLDKNRAHDRELIKKVETSLLQYNTSALNISILNPAEAAARTVQDLAAGNDAIAATGNVLRDYLTDLFPILELGTSAKMLSIVPLMNGGGLFETGAGGSAPKHVQQFEKEGHLRWDSLGEFLALAVSLELFSRTNSNTRAGILAQTLDSATGQFLENNKSPGRKVHEPDNRSSHYYLARYWARALADQTKDTQLAEDFAVLAEYLENNEEHIQKELLESQGGPQDIGGYYAPDFHKASRAMRPSSTLNKAWNLL